MTASPELAWHASTSGAVPVACGVVYLSGGDAITLGRKLRALDSASVVLGLSLDYLDGQDPRQTGVEIPDVELEDTLLARVAAFSALARRWGRQVETIGCHGSLALDVADDERTTQVIARALQRYNPGLSLAVAAGRRGIAVAYHCGIDVIREACMSVDTYEAEFPVANDDPFHVDRYRLC